MRPAEDVISVSSAQAFATCPRRFFYSHELRLRPVTDAPALTFGRAWHKVLEMAVGTKSTDALALVEGVARDITLDEDALAMLMAMAAGLFSAGHLPDLLRQVVATEERFAVDIGGGWRMVGVIDALTEAGEVIEYKTTSRDITPGSDYWLRLRHNLQVAAYARTVCRTTVRYVVALKPSLRRKSLPVLDDDGKKIVLDSATGERCYLKDGKPRQAAGEGMELMTREEKTEEFAGRLLEAIQSAPETYIAERVVTLDDEDIREAERVLATIIREVELMRGMAAGMERPDRAWRRNCSEFNCQSCPFAGPCLYFDFDPSGACPEGFATEP